MVFANLDRRATGSILVGTYVRPKVANQILESISSYGTGVAQPQPLEPGSRRPCRADRTFWRQSAEE